MKSLKEILEASMLDIEGTMIDGDDIVKSPKFVLDVKCKDIQQVADAVGECIGKKIKVKKMKGRWLVNAWGARIDVDGCPGFEIESIGKVRFGDAPIRKIWFADWDGRLICKQEIYDYQLKTGRKADYISNPKNYTKNKTHLGLIGSGTQRIDNIYNWGKDSLWEWLSKHGFNEFFDKNS